MERYIEKIKEEYPFFAALRLLYGIIFTVSLYENISESHFQYASESQLFLQKSF